MILGIDTSAYTTSIALMSNQEIILDRRILLKVKKGNRGLRQSEAVFQHVENLENLAQYIKDFKIAAIGVSNKPTPKLDSYMPVFKVGQSLAEFIAKVANIPVFKNSHQEGHIAAGLWSKNITQRNILAVHISGGTTDFLDVTNNYYDLSIQELGRSTDLHAGQFIDRVGVALGSSFPAGSTMDAWANSACELTLRLPSSVEGNNISFSGPETAAQKLIQDGFSKEAIANAVFICIARSLEKIIRNIYEKNKYGIILLVGGVAKNSIIKRELKKRLPYKMAFCDMNYSADNAVGTAILASKKYYNL